MAKVVVTLDTSTKKAFLAIDGVVISTDEFRISQYPDYETSEPVLTFGYSVSLDSGDGIKEYRSFTLSPDTGVSVNADGLYEYPGKLSSNLYDKDVAQSVAQQLRS